ncbi:MAG: hypothetical protein BMS9Abin33_0271 [Gammaproteobacteria bacterium]|nr:MAG: hypothetical protein BMS9Abin33_0271 [Gammaproteobacteria bacterium]
MQTTKFYIKKQMTTCDCQQTGSGQICVFSTPSPDKEGPNEDAAALIMRDRNTVVLAIADGLGGQPAGAQASEIAVKQVAAACQDIDNPDVRATILNGIEKANSKIIEQGSGSATTLAVAEVYGNNIRPYHIGDSVIMVIGQRGKIKLQTVAHSPVSYAVEAGLLDEGEAIHHQERHLVSNIVGSPEMRVEVGSPLSMSVRDTLLLGSDGLFDNLHIPEIVKIVRKGPLKKAAQQLISITRERMSSSKPDEPSKPDDLSFILYRHI